MDTTDIIALLTSIAALIGVLVTMFNAWNTKPKLTAESEKTNVDTIEMLSRQLHDAYTENSNLRTMTADINKHIDYEEYLKRGIARLTAALAANELSVPWIPVSFEEFVAREVTKKRNKEI